MKLIPAFEKIELTQTPCLENAHIDALLKLASNKDFELLTMVPIEHFPRPSTSKGEELMWETDTSSWMKPIIAFLKDQTLPPDKEAIQKLKRRVAHIVFQDDILYK